MALPINAEIQYSCELIDIGKGLIPTLTKDNLFYNIKKQAPIGLQDVIQTNGVLDEANSVNIYGEGVLFISASEDVNPNAHPSIYLDGATPSTSVSPMSIGYMDNDLAVLRGFDWYSNRTVFTDTVLNKGLENAGDYESNFTARSLITRQYFDDNVPVVDGSETKINQGNNVTITGNGTIATPYVINATLAQLVSGVTTTVTGNGTTGTPYVVEVVTPPVQKVITYPTDFTGTNYTLTSTDNNKLIFVVNGSTNVTITVPTGLPNEFFSAFIQEGTADVSFTGSGTTLNTATGSGFKIKGQNSQVALDKKGATTNFWLTGNTKI